MKKEEVQESVKLLTEIADSEMRKRMTIVTTIVLGMGAPFNTSFSSYSIRKTSELKIDKHTGLVEETETDYTKNHQPQNFNHNNFNIVPLSSKAQRIVPTTEYEMIIGQYDLNSESLTKIRDYMFNGSR